MCIEESNKQLDFIRTIIAEDVKKGKNDGRVVTRFPPEPNGYLHIGHAKSICLNFNIARENQPGVCHLRFDDTNPDKESIEYIESIKRDIKWLGYDWGEHLYFASDYFDKLYDYAVQLIKDGNAYVCSLNAEEIRNYRGTLKTPGKNSPYRNRAIEENLDLFRRMKDGEFEDGAYVLRAKIDMASPNLNMRDPTLYRIRYVPHHRVGKKWCIYPMYDFTHCLSDSIERITHSLCTLEFEDHRPLYDWTLDKLKVSCHPQQIEFARLNISNTVLSKRKLLILVKEGYVESWDDPRMPTLSGLRRRGYTPEAIRDFAERIGLAKANSTVDIAMLEHCLREDLHKRAPRAMAVLRPLKIVIKNYPNDKIEYLDADNNPEDPGAGKRQIPFSREIFIEKDDFLENPPKKFFRLAPGREIRLKYAYYIKCVDVIKNDKGEIIELNCTYDPQTKGGWSTDGRKVKGTSHWVSASTAVKAEVRLYNPLFNLESPDELKGDDFFKNINDNSMEVIKDCLLEPALAEANPLNIYQFERLGYFCTDTKSSDKMLVFNRAVSLRDTYSKILKKQKQ
jgi:glutaminyl-tRNA synthetase